MHLIPIFKRRLAAAAAIVTTSLWLSACGGGATSEASTPVCASGTYCSVNLRVDLAGLVATDQRVQLRLLPLSGTADAPVAQQALSCLASQCRTTISQTNLAPGYYRLNALSEQGQFLGSGVFEIGHGDDDGVLNVATILDLESTGYYVASLLTQGQSAFEASEFLTQLNVLTGANSDPVTEMHALGRYFLQQGGQDPAQHAPLVAKLRADVAQGVAPYEDGVLEAADVPATPANVSTGGSSLKLVTGPLGFGASFLFRGFVQSDAFRDDPVQASLHLLKVALGMSTDVKRLFASGGETRNALNKIETRLANQTAVIVGLVDELARFQERYNANQLVGSQNNFYAAIKAIEASSDLLDQLSENHRGCITLSNGASANLVGLSLRAYLDLFVQQPQNDPSGLTRSYNFTCLSDNLAQIYNDQRMSQLRLLHEALTEDTGVASLTAQIAVALKAATVQYPNNALRGRSDAKVRLLSDSYAMYNALLAKHMGDLGRASAIYAHIYDGLFYAREQFPVLRTRLYSGENLTSSLPARFNQAANAQPGANACHDASGQFFDLSRLDLELQMRCRFEMVMGYRAQQTASIGLLNFNNDRDLLRTLPDGAWRDDCRVKGLNVPDGPVVLDFDGVNLWTLCSADDKVANLPTARRSVARYDQDGGLKYRMVNAEMINCAALRQVKDYAETVWPKALEGKDDAGAVAIACALQNLNVPDAERRSNWAVGHINLARCGVEGSKPARISVQDGVLRCQDQHESQAYWGKYKLRLTASDTSGLLRRQFGNQFGVRTGVIGFSSIAGDRAMLTPGDTSISVADRRGNAFGRSVGGRRDITEEGRAMLFDIDARAYTAANIGDLLIHEMRYHKVIEIPQSAVTQAAFSDRVLSDQEAALIKKRNHPWFPLLVYRHFAMGMGVRYDTVLFLNGNRFFSIYLRCPEYDSGCKMQSPQSNDDNTNRSAQVQLTFGNAERWGPVKLRRYDNNTLQGDVAVPGYRDEFTSTYAYLTVGRN